MTYLKKIKPNAYQWMMILYVLVAVFCWQLKYFRHIDNNYLIYSNSFFHLKNHLNLYLDYPKEYYDVFLYGPIFTVFIAPMALLPEWLGFLIWELLNAGLFLYAIHKSPFNTKTKMLILLFCAIEFANSVHYMQINPIITSFIILSYLFVKKGKEQWATLFIVLGALMKIYPIAGLAFFMFSKNKLKFASWTAVWFAVFLFLPVVISGYDFLIQSYHDWFTALTSKNQLNVSLTSGQDWGIMGVVRRLLQRADIPNTPFLLAGAAIFGGALLRFKQYASEQFQLQILCALLIMVVIFSTGSEHPTFIIATTGAVMYIMMQEKPFTVFNIVMLILLLVVTGLGPSDAFPRFMRVWMQNYAVKAWPVIVIWFKMAYELLFKNFNRDKLAIFNT